MADTSKVKVALEQSLAISGPSTCCGRVIFWTKMRRRGCCQYAAKDGGDSIDKLYDQPSSMITLSAIMLSTVTAEACSSLKRFCRATGRGRFRYRRRNLKAMRSLRTSTFGAHQRPTDQLTNDGNARRWWSISFLSTSQSGVSDKRLICNTYCLSPP